MHPKELFYNFSTYYGPQNWWPGKGYAIAIGAILTQNTSWANVEIALKNLEEKNLLDPIQIISCDIDTLKDSIRPAGYFNKKARYLKNLSYLWVKNSTPTREELLAVNGIGQETADSILLYLLNQPEFVVDVYTVRISNRLGFGESKEKTYWKDYYQRSIEKNTKLYNEFHALFIIHAKQFCKKNNPLCLSCFLNHNCLFSKKRSRSDLI